MRISYSDCLQHDFARHFIWLRLPWAHLALFTNTNFYLLRDGVLSLKCVLGIFSFGSKEAPFCTNFACTTQFSYCEYFVRNTFELNIYDI
uniref:Uncharacterized protein n=1 Tax=Triticum urartu TaxID=4572 RepID=A0A8R7UM72_TRIUA